MHCLPLNQVVLLSSPYSPWFTSNLAILKRSIKKLERRIHLSPFHKLKFVMARKVYKLELNQQKTIYYEQKLNSCGNDSHNNFKIVNSILGTNIIPNIVHYLIPYYVLLL